MMKTTIALMAGMAFLVAGCNEPSQTPQQTQNPSATTTTEPAGASNAGDKNGYTGPGGTGGSKSGAGGAGPGYDGTAQSGGKHGTVPPSKEQLDQQK